MINIIINQVEHLITGCKVSSLHVFVNLNLLFRICKLVWKQTKMEKCPTSPEVAVSLFLAHRGGLTPVVGRVGGQSGRRPTASSTGGAAAGAESIVEHEVTALPPNEMLHRPQVHVRVEHLVVAQQLNPLFGHRHLAIILPVGGDR